MHKVSRDTYNRRGMPNMQLHNGSHGAWAGACRTSSGFFMVVCIYVFT